MYCVLGRGTIGSTIMRHLDDLGVKYDLYHSENINDLKYKSYEKIFCAIPTAKKYWVNSSNNARQDLKNIEDILSVLQTVNCDNFILISSQDVLHKESKNYGANRLFFENSIRVIFKCSIIRVGSLVGRYVQKNPIFDIIHDHRVQYLKNNAYQITNIDIIPYTQLEGDHNIWSDPYTLEDLNKLITNKERKFPQGDVVYNDPSDIKHNLDDILSGIKNMKIRYGVNSYTLNNDVKEIDKYPIYELSMYLYNDFLNGKVKRLPKSQISTLSSLITKGDTYGEALEEFRKSLDVAKELQIDKMMFGLKSVRDKYPQIINDTLEMTREFNRVNDTNIKLMFEVITDSKVLGTYKELKEFSLRNNISYYHLDEGSALNEFNTIKECAEFMTGLDCINIHYSIGNIPVDLIQSSILNTCDLSGERY